MSTAKSGNVPVALILGIISAIVLAVMIFFAGNPEGGLFSYRPIMFAIAGVLSAISLALTLFSKGAANSGLTLGISGITFAIVVVMFFFLS